jgi:predicted nucleic acid-binding protein
MIVVSDTSPLNYLILLGHTGILPVLFGRVLIPPGVATELAHPGAPGTVRGWIERPPPWLEVTAPMVVDPKIRLGRGEREAICLAMERKADYLLVDDSPARQAATERGLVITGTLGVLEAAAGRGLIELPTVIGRLRRTGFQITEQLLQAALARDARRRG